MRGWHVIPSSTLTPYYSPSQPRAKQTLRGFDPTFWCPGKAPSLISAWTNPSSSKDTTSPLPPSFHFGEVRLWASLMATDLCTVFVFAQYIPIWKASWKNNASIIKVFLTLIFLPQFIGIFSIIGLPRQPHPFYFFLVMATYLLFHFPMPSLNHSGICIYGRREKTSTQTGTTL